MSVAQPAAETFDVLIVEDEPHIAAIIKRIVESAGAYRARLLIDPDDMDAALDPLPDLVFTDLSMPGLDGFEVIRRVRERDADLPVVVVSAHASLENAVRAVKAGAFDFLAKPFKPESVELILAKTERDRALRCRVAAADPELAALLGESAQMRRVRQWIATVRSTRTNVLIEGESGTGKELAARALHGKRGAFVAVNAAAIPEGLAEAELFGYKRGAFTGATRDHIGLLREADGGTLFLDEVNAMPHALQAKLLRVLEEKRLRPVGASQDVATDFRLICAANVALETLVAQGGFRRDLYHRINVLHLRLPPLRERREDIPYLAEHFLQRYARAHGRNCRRLAPEVLTALVAAPWPGNVRELENVIEQAVVLCPPERTELPVDVLPPALGGRGWADSAASESDTPLALSEVERRHVREVLRRTGGNKSEAARLLAIDYKTLLRKLASTGETP
ncbi:MAG: sigma-54 dependent transcriptional regulator [Sulfuritalea sp.]|nr:sigma-54 dependent transcriptional regulator [Sulfuritalea sp.]MDP1983856.1 sigma-54 dependent transcriptional regulator [Sulfuritalea sp.]